MGAWHPGILYCGRILERRISPPGILLRVLIEDALVNLVATEERGAGLGLGDLIEFTVSARAAAPRRGRVEVPLVADHIRLLAAPVPGRAWSEGDALRWRRPGASPSRVALLRLRHKVVQAIRAHFDRQGFIEVETPALVPAPSPEPQFSPIAAGSRFLITSPEFQLKRMLVGGFERIYRIGPAFRGGERGRLHNPEFVLLEWYRANEGVEALARDLHGLLVALVPLAEAFARDSHAGDQAGGPRRAHSTRLVAEWVAIPLPQCTVAQAFQRHLGMDVRGISTKEALVAAAKAVDWPHARELDGDFDAVFSRLWIDIEAGLSPEPLLITEWPAPLASLAQLKRADPSVAERIELYAGGMELANGFLELTDAAQQRLRFERNLAARKLQGMSPLPLDEAFLRALEDGMPPSAGMALGLDRLVMLAAGASEIRDVLPFASEEL